MLKTPRSNSIPDITMIVSSFDDRLNKRRCNTIIIRSSASFSAIRALERFQTLAPPAHHFSSFSLPRPTPPSGRLAGAQGERQRGGGGEREREKERAQPFARFPNSMGTRKRVFERFAGVGWGWWWCCWPGGWQGVARGEISFTVQPV